MDIFTQSGVIPFRRSGHGFEVLLITSLNKGRWIIPKGVVETPLSPAESAAKEAWEEAGIEGQIVSEGLGSYEYAKWGGVCVVQVFALEVTTVADHWPEKAQRQRRWFSHVDAVVAINNDSLRNIMTSFPQFIEAGL